MALDFLSLIKQTVPGMEADENTRFMDVADTNRIYEASGV
jgi:hypothetical protein